ncbi:DUF72 domain-containing protein [Micromonospora sp. NPDC005367]|uniref:DUF72 domain-containing protein n=1 Tax=Micromonospora sp. NPDC005367 TaxID=3155590 RepID=UPI0033AD634B
MTPLWRTTDFGYLRLHEGRARPHPRYGRAALASWVRRLGDTFGEASAYVYFNNDPGGAAIADAVTFAALCRRDGLQVSRASAG